MLKRAILILSVFLVSSILVYTVLVVLSNNISFFVTPSELYDNIDNNVYKNINGVNKKLRVGGMLNEKSVVYTDNGLEFTIYDQAKELNVILRNKKKPPIFKEGEQVILLGRLEEGIFIAEKAISKHDERYYPKKG